MEGENSTKQQEERGAATEQGQQQGNMQTKTAAPSTRQQGTTNTGSKDAPSTSKQTQKTDTDSKESKQGAVGVKSGIKEGKPEQKEKTPWSTSAKMHTIALLQASKHDSTRFYQDYNSVAEAIEGLLRMYEMRLKELNPGAKSVTYDYNSLCQYIDDMKEVVILSWDPEVKAYRRFDRSWVKNALQDLLQGLVAARR